MCSAKARSSAKASTTSTRSSRRSAGVSRKPHSQPRPARGQLRALGAGHRRAAVRRLSVALQRRREPPPSLDPRRLADRGMAAAQGSRAATERARAIRSSLLSQWKIFDNLRRSLVPPALLLLLLLGLDGARDRRRHGRWSVLGILVLPSLIASLVDLLQKPDDVPLRQHLIFAARAAARHAVQIAFFAGLPSVRGVAPRGRHRAHASGGCWSRAGGCSNGRRRASRTDAIARPSARRFAAMWIAPAVAVVAGAYSCSRGLLQHCRSPLPFLLLWLVVARCSRGG